MVEYLDSVTLNDLVTQQRERLRRKAEEGNVGVLRDHRPKCSKPVEEATAGASNS
jgi:hypothetical protein